MIQPAYDNSPVGPNHTEIIPHTGIFAVNCVSGRPQFSVPFIIFLQNISVDVGASNPKETMTFQNS